MNLIFGFLRSPAASPRFNAMLKVSPQVFSGVQPNEQQH
jgi:hypothetical protein